MTMGWGEGWESAGRGTGCTGPSGRCSGLNWCGERPGAMVQDGKQMMGKQHAEA